LISCLNKLLLNRLVARFQPDIYKREIDRYSPELIQQVESVFASSSCAISNLLKQKCAMNYLDEKLMIEAAISVYGILEAFGFNGKERVELCKFQFDQFFKEFGSPKTLKPEIEIIHKKIHNDVSSNLHRDRSQKYDAQLKKDVLQLVQNFEMKNVKGITLEKLAIDIIHMHLNRLYIHDQRHSEMVTYYLLYRSLNAQLHRQQLPAIA